MYKFSAPMPYSKEDIDKILAINKQVEKSKITSLYNCVPRGCEIFTGFEQSRNYNQNYINWEYWKKLIGYILSKKCNFIYLLNNPKPLDINNPNFNQQLEKLELLLFELKKIGVNYLRIASPQLLTYIGKNYPDFTIFSSTSLEYKSICEYQNFIAFHPEVKQIVPSHDINKNFKLLSNLKKRYPNVEIEIMVNEGCLPGCPHRYLHESIDVDKFTIINNDECLSGRFCNYFCNPVVDKYAIQSLVIGTHIYPWEIEQYKKIGINKFKLVGRDGYINDIQDYINGFTTYLKGIDNIKLIENNSLSSFIHHLKNNNILKQLKIKDYIRYLPDIEYFKKNGHLCFSQCGIECKYCYKCAEKIEKKFFLKNKKEVIKRNTDFCCIKKINQVKYD